MDQLRLTKEQKWVLYYLNFEDDLGNNSYRNYDLTKILEEAGYSLNAELTTRLFNELKKLELIDGKHFSVAFLSQKGRQYVSEFPSDFIKEIGIMDKVRVDELFTIAEEKSQSSENAENRFNLSPSECFILRYLFDIEYEQPGRPILIDDLDSYLDQKSTQAAVTSLKEKSLVSHAEPVKGIPIENTLRITESAKETYLSNKNFIDASIIQLGKKAQRYFEAGSDKLEPPKEIEEDIEKVDFALSNKSTDNLLLRQGYKRHGLLGYASSIPGEKYEQLTGRFTHANVYQYFPSSIEFPFVSTFVNEQNDFTAYLIKANNLEHPAVALLPLSRFFNHDLSKGVVLTKPNEEELIRYNFKRTNDWMKSQLCLSTVSFVDSIPIYLYSTNPEIPFFKSLPEPLKETDAEFLHDNPSSIDELGRKSIINVIHTKLEKLWPKLESREPYMLLVNGEWGSGKSSMLYYFKETLEESKWEVIEYNAWKHQHLDNQWWILVNKVSRQLTPFFIRVPLIDSHSWWSCWLKNRNVIYFLFVITSLLIAANWYNPLGFSAQNISTYKGMLAIVGALTVLITGLVRNVFNKTITNSELARRFTDDPYKPIQDRFNKVVHNKNVAIFIDDLDRCEIKSTVQLLEGIQNLFKQTKVLYVIAADGNWVSNCFDVQYENFDKLSRKGHSIGNLFLQKSFQLIVDVPKMDKEQHKLIWGKYLGIEQKVESIVSPKDEQITTSKIQSAETTQELKSALKGSTTMEQREEAAERFGELVESRQDHVLTDFTSYIPRNPRLMKRLVNQYIIKSQSLIISNTQGKVSDEALVRYIIFDSTFPNFSCLVRNEKTTLEQLATEHEEVRELIGKELTTKLILDIL